MITVRIQVMLTVVCLSVSSGQDLSVATLNAWSGLSYRGVLTIDSYEDDASHNTRIDRLIEGLRAAHPDIIALQELNPVSAQSQKIASALGYTAIWLRVLSGFKAGPIGIPWNLNEGLAILARPELGLECIDVIPLTDGFGSIGDVLSVQSDEQNAALIGCVTLRTGVRVIVVTTHLPACPPATAATRERLMDLCLRREMTDTEASEWYDQMEKQDRDRSAMIDRLLDEVDDRFPEDPVILLGDFNLLHDAQDLVKISNRRGYVNVVTALGHEPIMTWDGLSNPLTRYSSDAVMPGVSETPIEELSRMIDAEPRSLDHIFVRSPITQQMLASITRILDAPVDGGYVSDHYGLMVSIDPSTMMRPVERTVATIEGFPLLSYDTDVGFGYGVKTFFLNQCDLRESFDIILFNSTKGERWYRLVFSVPDFELRQGTEYPIAVDVILDYDKFLRNVFFGIGPDSGPEDKEEYTREPFEAQIAFSRGMTRRTVIQGGIRYRRIRNANISASSTIPFVGAARSAGTATAVSLQASLRYDSRNSFINPSRGVVLQTGAEYASPPGNVVFLSTGVSMQYYTTLMYPKTVLAFRLHAQSLEGSEIPIQFLLPLGGNTSLRGYPQDRFLGRTMLVTNLEVRFPLFWRFGAVAGFDMGNIWRSSSDVNLVNMKSNSAVGLRFFMDTFIVRADLGFSPESTGFYLNFGHMF